MSFDKDKPAATTSLRQSNPEILANNSAIEDAMDNEHAFATGGTQDGDHTQGSARAFSQATAPATRIDGNTFEATDLGSLWTDTDDNAVYVLTATTPTWTPLSTEMIATLLGSPRVFTDTLGVTGDFAVNTDKFIVAAATGNALAAGTFESTGVATVGDGSLTKTSAAPTTDAMIANKKYVDDTAAATRTPVGPTSKVVALSTNLQVSTTKDAFLYLSAYHNAANRVGIDIYLGSSNPAGTKILIAAGDNTGGDNSEAVTVYVPAGWYFRVEKSTTPDRTAATPVITAEFVTIG